MGNPEIQAIGSWARYLGLGTLAMGNLEFQAIGSWAGYPGSNAHPPRTQRKHIA